MYNMCNVFLVKKYVRVVGLLAITHMPTAEKVLVSTLGPVHGPWEFLWPSLLRVGVHTFPLSVYLPSPLELHRPLYPLPSRTSETYLPFNVISHIAPLPFSLVTPTKAENPQKKENNYEY